MGRWRPGQLCGLEMSYSLCGGWGSCWESGVGEKEILRRLALLLLGDFVADEKE